MPIVTCSCLPKYLNSSPISKHFPANSISQFCVSFCRQHMTVHLLLNCHRSIYYPRIRQLPLSSLPDLKAPRFSAHHFPTVCSRSLASRQYSLEDTIIQGCPTMAYRPTKHNCARINFLINFSLCFIQYQALVTFGAWRHIAIHS